MNAHYQITISLAALLTVYLTGVANVAMIGKSIIKRNDWLAKKRLNTKLVAQNGVAEQITPRNGANIISSGIERIKTRYELEWIAGALITLIYGTHTAGSAGQK